MSDADFYNTNIYRRYPITEAGTLDETRCASAAIADFGIVFFDWTGFSPENPAHSVSCRKISKNELNAYYLFNVIANNTPLTSAAGAPTSPFVVEFADVLLASLTNYQLLTTSFSAGGRPAGYAFVVTGDVSRLVWSLVPSDGTDPGYSRMEPSTIQVQRGHSVNKITIANEPRVTAKPGCASSSSSLPAVGYTVAPDGEDVHGDVRFEEGYNCHIVVLAAANALRFDARRGAGDGEACEERPKTWEELYLAAEGVPLDFAARCDEAVTTINGVEPDLNGNFAFLAGKGITIDSPGEHTIRIRPNADIGVCSG